ncbi:MAG: HNH endonuclease [Pseudoclavibacter sp.]
MARRHAGGSRNSAMTRLVLEHYGVECYLRLPVCTYVATTRDHLIPLAHGGEDSLDNCRPACRSCNSKRQDKAVGGLGANIMIVAGPPAAGKSTYVIDHARPNDVIVDLDRLVDALTPGMRRTIEAPPHVKNLAIKARRTVINQAVRMYTACNVWLVHALPTAADLAEYRGNRWPIIMVDPGRTIVEERSRAERSPRMLRVIAEWYDLHHAGVSAAAARHVTEWDSDRPDTLLGAPPPSAALIEASPPAKSSSRPW